MGRALNRLTAVAVAKATKPGMLCDGAGLWLKIGGEGAKSWVFRYRHRGVDRYMGLGSILKVSLAAARDKAREVRQQLGAGVDPLEEKAAAALAARVERAKLITFAEVSASYISAHEAGWSNPKHTQQWQNTLATYAFPVFGSLPVSEVDTGLVVRALEPIWTTKPETAGRVRGRIEAILDYAKTRELRVGENPARWRGHLENLLPKRSRVSRVEHHAALPFKEIGQFLVALRLQDGVAARALEFAILTAARTGEVLGTRWVEIDMPAQVWTIPADRMKGQKEHRVPLSAPALELLEGMAAIRQGEHVFPGQRPGQPLSNMSMLMLLRRMGRDDLTAHGFRSSFRDWAAETTGYPGDVVEMALAHTIPGKVEAAYRRGDLFEKRCRLMADWARWCETPAAEPGAVVPIRQGAG